MKPTQGKEVRVVAGAIVLALLLQPLASAQQDPAIPSSVTQRAANQPPAEQFPDSPGTVQFAANTPQASPVKPDSTQGDSNATPDTDTTPQAQSAPASSEPPAPAAAPGDTGQPSTAAPQSQQQEQPAHEPLGAAAAESVPTSGIAASRPAGAAVAPAKQRRVRTILISMGALVAAGAAIGTTMALSHGSPSKPPGSH
jgi:hypothetical protein